MVQELELSVKPLPWHMPIWQRLLSNYQREHLAHALLLNGVPGIGKVQLALAFGQRLLCNTPDNEFACGQCKSCRLFDSGSHPNFFYVKPEEEGKAIVIQQVRALNEFATKKAQFEGYRIILIAPAEAMNLASANALLKTLEEPGSKTLIMLVSHLSGKLLATIKSRCQVVDCAQPTHPQALEWLSVHGHSQDSVESSLVMSEGAPLKALDILGQDLIAIRQKVVADLLSLRRKSESVVEVAARWNKATDFSEILQWLLSVSVDLAKLKVNEVARNTDVVRVLDEVSAGMQVNSCFQFHDQLMVVKRLYLSTANPNKQLLIERLLFDWVDLA
ncbi:MAG: DNA polymerase III subunit delta' [Gammaproteobacteria bacterium]|nr:MAG: DNA polymerase III subunit delta' [Gammaproteobacteria bacterium]